MLFFARWKGRSLEEECEQGRTWLKFKKEILEKFFVISLSQHMPPAMRVCASKKRREGNAENHFSGWR